MNCFIVILQGTVAGSQLRRNMWAPWVWRICWPSLERQRIQILLLFLLLFTSHFSVIHRSSPTIKKSSQILESQSFNRNIYNIYFQLGSIGSYFFFCFVMLFEKIAREQEALHQKQQKHLMEESASHSPWTFALFWWKYLILMRKVAPK